MHQQIFLKENRFHVTVRILSPKVLFKHRFYLHE